MSTNYTINWNPPNQEDLSHVRVYVTSTWYAHAEVYSVAIDAATTEIPVDDGKAVHWEVKAFYFGNLNHAVNVAAGDLYGGLRAPSPSNIKLVLFGGHDVCPNTETVDVLVAGCNPTEIGQGSPNGLWTTTKQEDGTWYAEMPTTYNNNPENFTMTLSCTESEDGASFYCSILHTVYGPVGAGSGQVFESIPINSNLPIFTAGTATVLL